MKSYSVNKILSIFCPPLLCKQPLVRYTVELQWLEHLRDYENMFETGVIRANKCYS